MIYGQKLALRALELSRRIRDRLRRKYSQSDAELDDAQQSAYVKLLEFGASDRPVIRDIDGYVYRATGNQLVQHLREQAARPVEPLGPSAEWVQDERRTPEEALDWAQRTRLVVEAALGLPKPLKKVLWLAKREGLSCPQIAARMGVTEARVKGDLAKAIYRMRQRVHCRVA